MAFFLNKDGQLLRQIKRLLMRKPLSYNFSTAFFDFKLLKEYYETLRFAIENNVQVRFIISQAISNEEFAKIKSAKEFNYKEFSFLTDKNNFSEVEKKFLFNAIQKDKIHFKIGFSLQGGILHTKMGFIEFEDKIFEWHGSLNHTFNGMMSVNAEQVFYNSIEGESEIRNNFNDIWNNNEESVICLDASLVLTEELATEVDNDTLIPWLTTKINKILFIDEEQLKVITPEKASYFLPSGAHWHKTKNGFRAESFNDYQISSFINENDEYFVTPKTRKFLNANANKIKLLIENGSKIKNDNFTNLESFDSFRDSLSDLKRRPYDQQIKQAFFAFKLKKSLNFSVPGTGKTMVSLMTLNALKHQGKVEKIIVIGPTSSHKTWEEEFTDTFGYKPKVLNISKLSLPYDEKFKVLNNLYKSDYDLIIGHYSTFSNYSSSLSKLSKKSLLIIDEAHYVKNNKGFWGKNISKLGERFEYAILLTGTPAPNGESDIYNLLRITYGETFLNYFKYSDDKETIITNIHMKVTFDDLKMTYKQLDSIVLYELNNQQMEESKSLTQKIKHGANPLEILIKKQQNTSAATSLEHFDEFNSPKLNKMLELIDPNKNILIWNIWTRSGESIEKCLKDKFPKVNIFLYNGEKQPEEREKIIELYKKDGGILIANPQTLAEAVSLHKNTNYTIYFEYSYNLTHWIQSRNRTFRAGMENDMKYYILKSNNDKMEEIILDRLLEKDEYQNRLINFENTNSEEEFETKLLNFLKEERY